MFILYEHLNYNNNQTNICIKNKKRFEKKRNFIESLTEEEIKNRKRQEKEILNNNAKNILN